jgi:hypothetical protein
MDPVASLQDDSIKKAAIAAFFHFQDSRGSSAAHLDYLDLVF